jgi:predicted O-methyltransferase YrrM
MINWPTEELVGKGWRYPFLYAAIDFIKPKTICEIGCHRGHSSSRLSARALQYNKDLYFAGYDLFDLATEETNKQEKNGKHAGDQKRVIGHLEKLKKVNPKFTYDLYKGFTRDTLEPRAFDFVYIDGGHSYETVKHDYEKLKDSKVIIFDDYDLKPVRQFCDEIGATGLVNYTWKKNLAVIVNV